VSLSIIKINKLKGKNNYKKLINKNNKNKKEI
jgi:hypothetical protein